MASMPNQTRNLSFKAISQETRSGIALGVRRYPQAFERVQQSSPGVVNGPGALVAVAGGRDVQCGSSHVEQPPVVVGEQYKLLIADACPQSRKVFHPADDFSLPFKVQLALVLQRETKERRNRAKAIAAAASCTERTAKNWMSASTEPGGNDLLKLMAAFSGVAEMVLKRTGLDPELVKLRALKAFLEE